MRNTHGTLLLVLFAAAAVLLVLNSAEVIAQTDPPALGDGDWTVRDVTVIRDWDVIMLRGDLLVTDGGDLTLINTTLLFVNADSGEHGVTVDNGASLHVVEGATVGSSRPNVPITFVVEAGCSLEIRDASIEEVGMAAFGIRPVWREIALYVGTNDAIIENSSFTGGMAGLYFEDGVIASPVRNCTFENVYGIISYGTSIEDCTFRNQNLYGVVFHGGDQGYIARCNFESVFATCVQVGFEYFEPPELHTAEARIIGCTFVHSTRAIRVLDWSIATIIDADIDGMEREGIAILDWANVHITNGIINNTFDAIFIERNSIVDWAITSSASVVGGSVMLSGDLTLFENATLSLKDFRNLTMLSRSNRPLSLALAQGSLLLAVNGNIEIPPPSQDDSWVPFELGPNPLNVEGSIYLENVHVFDVKDGYRLTNLTAKYCTFPLGNTTIERVYMQGCDLVPDPWGEDPHLTIGGLTKKTDCAFIDCRLVGIYRLPFQRALFTVLAARVRSVDFLYSIDEMLDKGALEAQGSAAGYADISVYWSTWTRIHWQNQVPIEGALVTISDTSGTVMGFTTDAKGHTVIHQVETERVTGSSYESLLPLEFAYNVSGLVGSKFVDYVDRPMLIDMIVYDLVPPRLVVDQGLQVATNSTNFTLTGQVVDEHSGVSFLEVAIMPADFIRVNVNPDTGRFEVNQVLRWGYQTISLRAYDNVGNRRTKVVDVFYSTVAPFIFVDEPIDGTWTNSNVTFIVGVTEPGAIIELGGRVTHADNGSFRIPADLEEGPNLLTVNVTSQAGNRNSTQVLVYLDTISPSLEIFHPPNSPFQTQEPAQNVRGLVEIGMEVFINGVPVVVEDDGTFTTQRVNLDQGSKMVTLTAMDLAGNVNIIEVIFILDSVPPSLVVLVEGEDATKYTGEDLLRTSSDSVALTISTDEGSMVEVDGEVITLQGSEAVLDYPLVEGIQTIVVYVEDNAGNGIAFDPINIEVDWNPPNITLDPTLPSHTEEALFTLRGTTEPNCTVTVNGARVAVDSTGFFIKNFLLNEGSNQLVIVTTDRFGQSTSKVLDVEMSPPEPEPWPDSPSILPQMLVFTVAVLVIEVVALELWWRRKRTPPKDSD
jgi:hypothetical protein